MRIGAVIAARNEGSQVERTVRSLLASRGDEELLVIVVDDGSTDGSCDAAPAWGDLSACGDAQAGGEGRVMRVRNEPGMGLGRARNLGAEIALREGCEAVSFHDAHMRFGPGGEGMPERGGLEMLAAKALETGAVCCAGSNGLSGANRIWGCDLYWSANGGLQPKWRWSDSVPEEEWPRSAGLMGAGYVMGAETIRRLSAPTGRLWEDTAGRWGFSEEALSVKAFLLDVPILFARDVIFRHLYRDRNPLPDAGVERWRNVTRCTRVLFGREIFEARFRDLCVQVLGKRHVDAIVEGLPDVDWPLWPGAAFTHLLGQNAEPGKVHADHAWWGPGAWGHVPSFDRVLQWRPGESTVWLRSEHPEAEIDCIELDGFRARTWAPWCKRHGVTLTTCKLGPDYARQPLQWGRRYDLVLVGGELQEECRAVAERVLAPGGRIVTNPRADRLLLHPEFRGPEIKLLARYQQRKGKPPARPAQPADAGLPADARAPVRPAQPAEAGPPADARAPQAPLVTACLLNYARPENIGQVILSLARQTVPVRILLWDNAEEPGVGLHYEGGDGAMRPLAEHPAVELAVRPGRNFGCWARWLLAAQAETEFVCTLDDDLVLADERVLEDAVAAQREECPDGIVGWFGWSDDGEGYRKGRHHQGSSDGRPCELIKGRFMLVPTRLLERVPLSPPAWGEAEPIGFRCDDIVVSYAVGGGREDAHLVPQRLGKRWKNLPRRNTGLDRERQHYRLREAAIGRMREWLGGTH